MASAGLATLARCQERVRSDGVVREDKEKKREQERKRKRERKTRNRSRRKEKTGNKIRKYGG